MKLLSDDMLNEYRVRRQSGISVKLLAEELGLTWQKLDKALRNGLPNSKPRPQLKLVSKLPAIDYMDELPYAKTIYVDQDIRGSSWVERYRPRTLDTLLGQREVVQILKKYLNNPVSKAFLFSGNTGTGKTSASTILASSLGCDVDAREMGGVYNIASGEQTADSVRDLFQSFMYRPFKGSGWRVAVVNEADRMSSQAETIWLDRLESLPKMTTIVFTTNNPGKLSDRFRDRCLQVHFASSEKELAIDLNNFLFSVWEKETGEFLSHSNLVSTVRESRLNGELSFRRALQLLEKKYLARC